MDAMIIFNDGSSRRVPHQTASFVKQVLLGERKPKSKANELFCMRVRDVVFDQTELIPLPFDDLPVAKKVHDGMVRTILNDPRLTGHEKAREVSHAIRRRRVAREQQRLFDKVHAYIA